MDTPPKAVRTGAVVALKPPELAKSRLAPLPAPLRRRLAWSMAVDTLAALAAAVDRLVVVGDESGLESRLRGLGLAVTVRPEPQQPGMNSALAAGDEWLRDQGCEVVLACVGDLPALRPQSVRRVLAGAAALPRAYLADASGYGTTMLLATGAALSPRFQGPSAAAHTKSGAVALTDERLGRAVPDARQDVDTEADLRAAAPLGLGRATAALLDPRTSALGAYSVLTVSETGGAAGPIPTGVPDAAGSAVTAGGQRVVLPGTALQDGLRDVRAGQRLHAVTSGGRVLAAWL